MMEDKVLYDVLQVMLDNKAEDLVYLNVEKVNPYAAYYIICSVSSNRHALALAKYVEHELAKNNINVKHIEGNSSSEWILVDGIDYIVHIFVNDARRRYGLENLWSELDIIKEKMSYVNEQNLNLSILNKK